jgi:3-hydroxybutyryl-CoA dehydrogenase
MGAGIAELCASHGYEVRVLDVDQQRLDKGLAAIRRRMARESKRGGLAQERYEAAINGLKGTVVVQDLSECDLVIEAAFEDLATKQDLFAALGGVCKAEAILASNTSSLSISALATASGRAEKVIGLHFFNPPAVLRLVEIIVAESTSQDTIDVATAFSDSVDRVVVRVKDTPGFIVNRLLVPFIFEAIRMVESSTATAKHVDEACKSGLGHAMGPLATADLIGLDTLIHVGESMYEGCGEPSLEAPTMLRDMVSQGNLGRKSGKGFFDYRG